MSVLSDAVVGILGVVKDILKIKLKKGPNVDRLPVILPPPSKIANEPFRLLDTPKPPKLTK